MKKTLLKKINNKESVIGIIGMGYVGLPQLIRFSEVGYKTIGFDIDQEKIDLLNKGKSYIHHIPNKKIRNSIQNGFYATSDFSNISQVDFIFICVPTPLKAHNEPDISYINSSVIEISKNIKRGQVIVLESTTYPGTTEEQIVSTMEDLGFTIGKDLFVGYSPEREDPGNPNYNTKNTPKIVSGHTKHCLDLIKTMYDQIIDKTIPVSSTKIAEMTKIIENTQRAINIGLVNELKIVANNMDIDIVEALNAAATKPYGFTPYYPGPGLGGHCIPIDPYYLAWKAKQYGIITRFIHLAGEINNYMPEYVIEILIEALNTKKKSLKGSTVIVLGLSYKKNVDDLRESPSLEIINLLLSKGAKVEYSDPYISQIPKTRQYSFSLKRKELTKNVLSSADAVIIATDHDEFDYDLIENESKIIIDTRGKFSVSNEKVFRA